MPATKGPLEAALEDEGATFGTREGRRVALHFGDPRGESLAARRDVVVADRSHRAVLELQGPDRLGYLQGQVTQEVGSLQPGEGAYGFVMAPRGGTVAAVHVMVLPGRVLLDCSPTCAEPLFERLSRYLVVEDAGIADVSRDWARILVAGPGAAACLQEHLQVSEIPGREDHHRPARFQQTELLVVRTGTFGLAAFELLVPADGAGPVFRALRAGGRRPLAGYEALEILRVETGRPRFGADLTAEVLPKESGQEERAVSYDKGCYTGQEQVAMQHFRGKPRKMLRGLALEEGETAAGDPVFRGDRACGHLTSVVRSAVLDRPVALALLKGTDHPEGLELEVRPADGRPPVPGRVAVLPFVTCGGGPA